MDIIEYTEVFADGSQVVYVRLDYGNGEFTSMTKEHWDKLEAEREQSGTL